MDFWIKEGLITAPKFAIQDIHADILDNIERPDVPWAQHKVMIDRLVANNPHVIPRVELIQGLPGCTRTTWEQTLLSVEPYYTIVYPWNVLPNSPAGRDADYIKKMALKSIKTIDLAIIGVPDYTKNLVDLVVETFSYDMLDYCYFTLLSYVAQHPVFQRKNCKTMLFELVKNSAKLDKCLKDIKQSLVNTTEVQTTMDAFIRHIIRNEAVDPNLRKDYVQYVLGSNNVATAIHYSS